MRSTSAAFPALSPNPSRRCRHGARSALRHSVRAGEDRPQGREEPLLPGAALQRRRLSRSQRQCRDAAGEGDRRLGGAVHRAGGDPSHLGDHALHRAAPVGRCGHADADPHRRCDPRRRRAGWDRALLQRHERPQSLFARDAAGADEPADPHLHQRSGAGARDGPRGHPQPAALASHGGAAREAGRLRSGLCLWRAWLRHGAAFPLAPHQPAHRRIWRIAGEPRAAAQGADRGYQGCDRRFLRRAGAHPGGRDAGRRRHHQCGDPRRHRHAGRAARFVGPGARLLGLLLRHLALFRRRVSRRAMSRASRR